MHVSKSALFREFSCDASPTLLKLLIVTDDPSEGGVGVVGVPTVLSGTFVDVDDVVLEVLTAVVVLSNFVLTADGVSSSSEREEKLSSDSIASWILGIATQRGGAGAAGRDAQGTGSSAGARSIASDVPDGDSSGVWSS